MANNIKSNRIPDFVQKVLKGGLSFDNDYTFSVEISPNFRTAFQNAFPLTFENSVKNSNFPYEIGRTNSDSIKDYLENEVSGFKFAVLCDEISIPGVSTATGFVKGNNQGQTLIYAHTKIYNSVSLSFLCDRDMTALKFFHFWMNWIHPTVIPPNFLENIPSTGAALGTSEYPISKEESLSKDPSYAATTRYFDDYAFTFDIYKMETKYNPPSISVRSRLFDAFPTKISAIPLSSGASSIARVSVDITYGRHTTSFETYPQQDGSNIERYYGINV